MLDFYFQNDFENDIYVTCLLTKFTKYSIKSVYWTSDKTCVVGFIMTVHGNYAFVDKVYFFDIPSSKVAFHLLEIGLRDILSCFR